ncbi:MAG: VIT1/CCC1 transporter family protein, partial [Candidatus Limnocylindria bacterium]
MVPPPAGPVAASPPASGADVARWRANLQGEIDGIAIYRAMASGTRDPSLTDLYQRLAVTEERHAAIWRERLGAAGAAVPANPTLRARILAAIARRFGPGLVASTVAGQEAAARGQYDDQPEARGTGMPADERSHARVLRELTTGMSGSSLAGFEGRHKAVGGNALRA